MGLAAVPGVVRYLQEHTIGFDWGISNIHVPTVVGAVIDDLALGDGKIRPHSESAYRACQAASSGPGGEGNVGAGATIGRILQSQEFRGVKSGLGTSSVRVEEVTLGVLVMNAVGDILGWHCGKIVAGARRVDG